MVTSALQFVEDFVFRIPDSDVIRFHYDYDDDAQKITTLDTNHNDKDPTTTPTATTKLLECLCYSHVNNLVF